MCTGCLDIVAEAWELSAHPDDDYALENENQYWKNEMWYVVDSKPDAGLYVGFNRDVDKDEVRRRVHDY